MVFKIKWQRPQPNFKIGDLILLYDDSVPRGKWTLARIINTFPDDLGTVRQVKYVPRAIRCCVDQLQNCVVFCRIKKKF